MSAVIYARLIAWHNITIIIIIIIIIIICRLAQTVKQRKAYQKDLDKGLMLVAWHSTRGSDWYLSKEKKKQIEPAFTDKLGKS